MSMKGEIIWRIGLIYVLMTLIAGAIIFQDPFMCRCGRGKVAEEIGCCTDKRF